MDRRGGTLVQQLVQLLHNATTCPLHWWVSGCFCTRTLCASNTRCLPLDRRGVRTIMPDCSMAITGLQW
jgi:hypothetical protein